MDEGRPVDIIYLDFANAFHKVPCQRLFKKLGAHGIGGSISRWIQNWLSGRRQKVSINKNYSDWQEVRSGFPRDQFWVLSFFKIYINDLDVGLISKLGKFADDTELGRGVPNEIEIQSLRDDLNKIFQWSVDW